MNAFMRELGDFDELVRRYHPQVSDWEIWGASLVFDENYKAVELRVAGKSFDVTQLPQLPEGEAA